MAQGTSIFLSASASFAGSRRHFVSTSPSGTGIHGPAPGSPRGGMPASASLIASAPASTPPVPAPLAELDAIPLPPPPPVPVVLPELPTTSLPQPETTNKPKQSHRNDMRAM